MRSLIRWRSAALACLLMLTSAIEYTTASSSAEEASSEIQESETVEAEEVCEFWGVGVGCNYNGEYKRPERCKGLGRRYCDRAPEANTCPEACTQSQCRRNDQDIYQHYKDDFFFSWEDLVLASHYDMVFTDGQEVCVQTCWKDPWNMKCKKDRMYNGTKYCVDIECEHDPLNRFVGCHKEFPWHRPTCNECAKLFPKACAAEIQQYVDKTSPSLEYQDLKNWEDVSEKAEAFGIDMSDAKNFESGESEVLKKPSDSPGSKKKNSGDDDDDDDDDQSDSDDDEDSCSDDDSDDSSSNCVKANADSLLVNPDSFDMVPIIFEQDGADFMSFNEIQFQVQGAEADIDQLAITAAVAELAGVEAHQVQTVSIVADFGPQRDLAETDANLIAPTATVTTVIWTHDPYSIDMELLNMEDQGTLTQNMISAGIDSYLELSASLNVISAPITEMENVFPDAFMYADQVDVPSRSDTSATQILGIGLGAAGGVLLLTAAAFAYFCCCRGRRPEEEPPTTDDFSAECMKKHSACGVISMVDSGDIGTITSPTKSESRV